MISFDEKTAEIYEKKMRKNRGLISQICRDAIKEWDGYNCTIIELQEKINELKESKENIDITLKHHEEVMKKLRQKEENEKLSREVQVKEDIEEEVEKDTPEKLERRIKMYEENLAKHYIMIQPHTPTALAEEYVLYLNNCKSANQIPLNLIFYAKSKGIEKKPEVKKDGNV